MKKIILLLQTFTCFSLLEAQCPPGAEVLFVLEYDNHLVIDSITGVPGMQDISRVMVTQFPTDSQVYIYNNNNDLIDSLITDNAGGGWVHVLFTDFPGNDSMQTLGTVVSGNCSMPLRWVGLLPIRLKTFTVSTLDNKQQLVWTVESETPGTRYEVQESTDGVYFETVHQINGNNSVANEKQYQYTFPSISRRKFYRIKIIELNNWVKYSAVKMVFSKESQHMEVYPTVSNDNFHTEVPVIFLQGYYTIYDSNGIIVQKGNIISTTFNIKASFGRGIFFIKAIAIDGSSSSKTIIVQ